MSLGDFLSAPEDPTMRDSEDVVESVSLDLPTTLKVIRNVIESEVGEVCKCTRIASTGGYIEQPNPPGIDGREVSLSEAGTAKWSIVSQLDHAFQMHVLYILEEGFGLAVHGLMAEAIGSGSTDYMDKLLLYSKTVEGITFERAFEKGVMAADEQKMVGRAKSFGVLVGFLCRYQEFVNSLALSFGFEQMRKYLFDLANPLISQYVETTRPKMVKVMRQIVRTEQELEETPEETADEYLYTHLSNDLFSVLEKQISIGKRYGFSASATARVRIFAVDLVCWVESALVEWLKGFRIDDEQHIWMKDTLASDSDGEPTDGTAEGKRKETKKSEAHMAAIVNGATSIKTHLARMLEGARSQIRGNQELHNFDRIVERAESLNKQVVLRANIVLVKLMASTVQNASALLFKKEHLQSSRDKARGANSNDRPSTVVGEIIATIYDFFSDFIRWIRDRDHILQLTKLMIRHLAFTYFRALITNYKTAARWDSKSPVLIQMKQDCKAMSRLLLKVQQKVVKERMATGSADESNDELVGIFDTIARILLAKAPDEVRCCSGNYVDYFSRIEGKQNLEADFGQLLSLNKHLGRKERSALLEEFKQQILDNHETVSRRNSNIIIGEVVGENQGFGQSVVDPLTAAFSAAASQVTHPLGFLKYFR